MIALTEHKDFIGENLNVGDIVVYLKNSRSYGYKTSVCKCVGMIERFTNQMVVVKPLGPMNMFVTPNEYDDTRKSIRLALTNIICIVK